MNKIGLTLSGGGVRASAFHAGVLLYLAEKGFVENINYLSTVSGGTLFAGLVYHLSDKNWPSSEQYQSKIFHDIRKTLTGISLQHQLYLKTFQRENWKNFFSRAKVLEQVLVEDWQITHLCSELPAKPIWTINGTTAETGKRFRYKAGSFGDYTLGYADASNFKLASAMAMSAAFPFGIGPLPLNAVNYTWKKKPTWNAIKEDIVSIDFNTLHLYDAGLYDNLGIEPFFDMGRQSIKPNLDIDFLFVSDASAPFVSSPIPHPMSFRRAQKIMDILTEQIRFLRVRSLMNYFKNSSAGLMCVIGDSPFTFIQNKGLTEHVISELLSEKWLDGGELNHAHRYKTTLKKMTFTDFDIISRHGYETAKLRFILNSHGYNDLYPSSLTH